MNEVEQDKLFFKEAKRQISKLKNQNDELHEALKYAYELLKDQAEKGRYPEKALQENGGEGFRPIELALKQIES